MKLNYKRTIFVGFAFFLICAFWNAYDSIIPLILTNKFNMMQTYSGIIMSLDNIIAIVLLPIFGALSDRVDTKIGRRTPFIIVGTCLASVAFVALGFINDLAVFIVVLLLSLFAMATFRSPAVALMPDVTLKPLRSKGNAVINLMGTAGGIIILLFASVFHTSEAGKTDFGAYMISVVGVMMFGLIMFLITVREKKWAAEMEAESEKLGLNLTEGDRDSGKTGADANGKLSKGEFRSLVFILLSVAFWFIGYNAVTSKYSVYATDVLHVSYSLTLLIAQAAAIVSYIPVGLISSKFGRKRTILAGVVLLTVSFGSAAFITESTPGFLMYIVFALAGIAWATINVNSFPMVVELASRGNTGKFTGLYYTASMAAQVVTPIFSGFLVDRFGWGIFFPYAAIFCAISFVTMLFVKHGDSKPDAKQTALDALAGGDD